MKKIILLVFILLLTGCGNSCEKNFKFNMTKNYSKDAKKCETVKYTSKKYGLEVVTTPSDDKKSFRATITQNGRKLEYSYYDVDFTNLMIKQYNGINFLELYDDSKINNTYLVLFDDVANIRYEATSTTSPVVNGEKFTVKEYRTFVDGDYICANYLELDRIAYYEKTYNMMDMTVLNEKKYLVKDVCK